MIKEGIVKKSGIKTLENWRKINQEWEKTKEPQKQFCKKHNITYDAFIYWRAKLVKPSINKTNRVHFQQIKVSSAHPVSSAQIQQTIKIIFPGNIVVTIPIDIDEQALIKLFKSLQGLSHA
jgi:hypothetical protein